MNSVLMVYLQLKVIRRIRTLLEESRKRSVLQIERSLLRSQDIDRISNLEFINTYRIRKRTFYIILHQIKPYLKPASRASAISQETKLLTTLRFLAQGSYQKNVGSDYLTAIAQPSVSKVLKEVLLVINEHICPQYIKFPNAQERNTTKEWFSTNYNLQGVIGAVDGSQIPIYPPNINQNEHIYVNRKGYHSLNVQLIVDHCYKVIGISAKFPGSAHDSHVWRMSSIRDCLQEEYFGGGEEWLLGDSGYPLEPWLITPYPGADAEDEINFNTVHSKARSIVERAIGTLKGRWRCLCKQRWLHYNPIVAGRIINACAALHNICILQNDNLLLDYNVFLEEDADEAEAHENNAVGNGNVDLFAIGSARRNNLAALLIQ